MDNFAFFGTIAGVVFVALLVIVFTMTRLYKRASKEQAYVRTGMGGQKVVKDGGALVLPVFHEIIPINMQTLRLTVERRGQESLITNDRLRVDVKAEFYVRVSPDDDGIAAAAQTLGRRTMEPAKLSELIEGKFVDVLRAVAAGMNMHDLHEKRADFVQKVSNTVQEDLRKNGLELESVSLTGLDQTDRQFFNENNAFDAEGLKKLTEVTESRRKERNDIEQSTRVAIEEKNLEANKRSLTIKQEDEFATLEQERAVETQRAEQEANLATTRAERKREADLARIKAEREVEEGNVAKVTGVQIAETTAARDLELAAQDQRIAVAERSKAQSQAQAEAEDARAKAVRAQEEVKTVEAEAAAERNKRVAVIAAEQEAEQDATRIRVIAEAEFEAADAQAKAKERAAEADAKRYEVEARGQRELNEAANLLSADQVQLKLRLALIDKLPTILEQMTKPIEKIDSIRVVQMGGGFANGNGGNGAVSGPQSTGNLPADLTNSMLNYRFQAPVVDELAKELGIDLNKGLNGIVDAAAGGTVSHTVDTDEVSEPKAAPSSERQILNEDLGDIDDQLSEEERAAIHSLAGVRPESK